MVYERVDNDTCLDKLLQGSIHLLAKFLVICQQLIRIALFGVDHVRIGYKGIFIFVSRSNALHIMAIVYGKHGILALFGVMYKYICIRDNGYYAYHFILVEQKLLVVDDKVTALPKLA